MAPYTISYDLNRPGQEYQSLYNELERLGGRRVLLSVWVLRSNSTPKQLADHLLRYLDSNDRLLVVDGSSGAAWSQNVGATVQQVYRIVA